MSTELFFGNLDKCHKLNSIPKLQYVQGMQAEFKRPSIRTYSYPASHPMLPCFSKEFGLDLPDSDFGKVLKMLRAWEQVKTNEKDFFNSLYQGQDG